MVRFFREYWIFLIIPVVVFIMSAGLKLVMGPYWLATNLDPSYQYLVNGVYLVKGFVPNHMDHPGTPLQMLCWLVCWIFNVGRPAADVVTRVLSEPEFYLQAVSWMLVGGYFLISVVLAVYVYEKTRDKIAAGLSQLAGMIFLALQTGVTVQIVVTVLVNVSPEPLLIIAVSLFNLCLMRLFFAKTLKDEFFAVFLWAAVCGAGVAVKLTFLPLLIVPLMLTSWRQKGLFCGVFLVSFFLWTLPILSRYVYLWQWVSGLVLHTGVHGSGGAGIVDIHGFLSAVIGIIRQQWFFAGMILSAFGVMAVKALYKEWDKGAFYLSAITLGVLLQFLVVAKHPGAHYLVPGLGLFSVFFVFLYLQWPARSSFGRRAAVLFILVFVITGICQTTVYGVKIQDFSKGLLSFHSKVRAKYSNCQFLGYYACSGKKEALNFGDSWNLSSRLGEDLKKVYPDTYFFQRWVYVITDFNSRVWSEDLLAQAPCVIFQGVQGFDFSQGPYQVRLLEEGNYEAVYLLTATTEKRAAMFYAQAHQLAGAGDYARALAFALQAKELHYYPADRVEDLIQRLSSRAQR